MFKVIGSIVLVLGLATAAHAAIPVAVAAPEIDPASALGALTLLSSGLLIVSGRRLKKK